MKKLNLTSVAVAALIALSVVACRKDRGNQPSVIINPDATPQEFVANNGPKVQAKQINASSLPQTVTLAGGTKITFPAGSLNISGAPATGTATVNVIEVLKRSDVIKFGSNTNHISGAPLQSDGFIYVDVKVNGVSVDRNLAAPMRIEIPAKRAGFTNIWEGVNQGGAPLQPGADAQMAWAAPRQANGQGGGKEVPPVGGFYSFDFGTTGWVNTDIFYSYNNPKTTVRVDLINNPGGLSSFHSYSGETYVFFCAKGANVVSQLYTVDGPNRVKSYDNVMPVGVEGKLLSFSIKDGKYYLAVQETTITANQVASLTLAQVTQADVQAAISSLDNY
ncbi:hypothetical protein [Mucilaginibacter myungsuensis]|uniref:Uncharacterized protein n=1 Tax=Mucilaginibacter myungsuensis TaxID=649104 RepID=A0A929PV56_9SPHI|nr:hypothetical protein [Mucilaginibacter myungsuensis]MBE9660784.1 hypothetical protein [Mucilaginibacter myungsuensis]MDN3600830.1 hypothetical protein [Mucilaginibacter myungsuensis]